MNKGKLLILATAILGLVTTGCKEHPTNNRTKPIRVETAKVETQKVSNGRIYSGVIEESSGTVLSFKVPGTISRICVNEGQRVKKGQLIAELDAASLQSNLEIAQAAEATAQDTYNRMKALHDANSIPDMKWVEVENALSAAKSATAIARNALADAKIHAPFSGYISKKTADAGMTVLPSVPVVNLVEISPVKINISVSENEISAITTSTDAVATVSALGGKTYHVAFAEKGVSADPLSRTYTVKFKSTNPDGEMLPGMLCNVSLESEGSRDAIVCPTDAILLDADNVCYVWLMQNGVAKKRTVSLGNYTATGVIVEEGLLPGEEIIVKGMQKVSEDMAVTPVKP